MKTVTVTFYQALNYGAQLQAYGLQQTLLSMGHENAILDYGEGGRAPKRILWRNPRVAARTLCLSLLRLYRRNAMNRLNKEFERFRREHLIFSPAFYTMQDLRDTPPDADCLIAGSDQIWNMNISPECVPARFLDFGAPSVRRISYGASIEALHYTEEQKSRVADWLSRFDAISLREEKACRYIEDIVKKPAELVCDPVFLLTREDWLKVAKPARIKGPYILSYQVQGNPRMQEVTDRLHRETGYPVVSVCNSPLRRIRADHTFFDVSPEEFVGFCAGAEIVVSASFHGAVLGLLFGKPTYGLVRAATVGRIGELLDRFGLGRFCIGQGSEIPAPQIDGEALAASIEAVRARGLEYLKTQLKEEKS